MKWINYPPKRNINDPSLGKVLLDIESHMPKAGHIYRDNDKVTWAHETTHGLNSFVRNEFRQNANLINGFYVLENRAIIIPEPPTTMWEVANRVPSSLRGAVYNLYMVQQARSWNTNPLYIFDEWIAYTNGSAAGLDLAEKNLWGNSQRGATIANMLEFNMYSMTLCMIVEVQGGFSSAQLLRDFARWNWYRSLALFRLSKQYPQFADVAHDEYLHRLERSSDCRDLQRFIVDYLAEEINNSIIENRII